MGDRVAQSEKKPWIIADGLQERLKKHIVPFSWLDVADAATAHESMIPHLVLGTLCISSFVVLFQGYWFLITAGHVIPMLRERLNSGRKILKSRLLTEIAGGEGCDALPCDLAKEPAWYIDQHGIDGAAIVLRPFYVKYLLACGVCALTEAQWTSVPDSPCAYYLLGLPDQVQQRNLTTHRTGGNISHTIWMPFLPLCRTKNPPEVLRPEIPRFYAHVPSVDAPPELGELGFESIAGMSGGPIFAVRDPRSDQSEYWLVAVQNSWDADKRVLAATFMETIAEKIEQWIDAQGSKLAGYQVSQS
jgi:hypothetical protein